MERCTTHRNCIVSIAAVTQVDERQASNLGAAGSSPAGSTIHPCVRCGKSRTQDEADDSPDLCVWCDNLRLAEGIMESTALDERVANAKQSTVPPCLNNDRTVDGIREECWNIGARASYRGGRQLAGLTRGVWPWGGR